MQAEIDHLLQARTVSEVKAYCETLKTAAAERTVKLHQFLEAHADELLFAGDQMLTLKSESEVARDSVVKVSLSVSDGEQKTTHNTTHNSISL